MIKEYLAQPMINLGLCLFFSSLGVLVFKKEADKSARQGKDKKNLVAGVILIALGLFFLYNFWMLRKYGAPAD